MKSNISIPLNHKEIADDIYKIIQKRPFALQKFVKWHIL